MSRDRGKRNKRGGGGRKFFAESAAEIEQRNSRLEAFEEERALRRVDSDEEEGEGGGGGEGDETKKEGAGAPDNGPNEEEKIESRKEQAARERAENYRKRHEAGLTEEYKKDMAKLEEVRKRREQAAARKKAEQEEEDLAEEERKMQALKLQEETSSGDKKSKRSSKTVSIPKLDKISIKKMKPKDMKEALKERDLPIQGTGKQLQQRLIDYEAAR